MESTEEDAEKGRLFEEEDPLKNNLLSNHDLTETRQSSNGSSWLPKSHVPWIFSTAISISSTRYILITQHFHFPVILLVWQVAATMILMYSYTRYRRRLSRGLESDAQETTPLNLRALLSLAHAAPALIVTNQAILHFTNVASLAMFSVHTLSILEICRLLSYLCWSPLVKRQRPKLESLLYLLLAIGCACASYGILSRDYRRSSRGDRSLLVAAYLTAFAQLLLTSSSQRDPRGRKSGVQPFQLVLCACAFVIGLFWYFPYEGPYTRLQLPGFFILTLNLLSSGASIATGGSVLIPLSPAAESEAEDESRFSHATKQRVTSCFSVAGIVAFLSLQLPNRGYVNALQLVLYAISISILFIGASFGAQKFSLWTIFRLKKSNRGVTVLVLLCWVAYIPLNFNDYPWNPAQPVSHPTLDHQYRTARRFEIVVAHTHEPPENIARLVSAIVSAPPIKKFNPRVLIYTKNARLDINVFRNSLQQAFSNDPKNRDRFSVAARLSMFPNMEIKRIVPNAGREGHTYLYHIARHWDTLAQHTLYTQASTDDLDEVVERLNYFIPGPAIPPLAASHKRTITAESISLGMSKISSFLPSLESSKFSGSNLKLINADSTGATGGLVKRAAWVPPKATGFLPLSFTTEVCDCHKCSDTWGWYDTSPLIAAAFSKVYGLPKPLCDKVLLVYKGAFIVSGQRTHGVDRMTYVDYRNALSQEDRWEHSREYLENFTGHGGVNAADGVVANPMLMKSSDSVKDAAAAMRVGRPSGTTSHRWGEKDSLERPWFGYTVERMWSVLFQCNDMDIAWKCPTFRGKWRSSFHGVDGGSDLRDCQCLDSIRPPEE